MKIIQHILLIAFITLFSAITASAQSGTVRGTVIEASTGEPLIGVNVLVEGTSTGTSTDVDGKFSLNLDSGTYSLRISYVSFNTATITDVQVTSGEVTVLNNIALEQSNQELEEVVVTASALNDTEAALVTKKRNLPNMIDGISSETFTKTGLSSASEALKKVTGVSIEGGKYVYVRGLGDRYTKTLLNNVEVPSLDPDKNSLQVDIFPTNIIDNMVISKTAVASMPADFTGGIVNIETKSFPEQPIFEVSASIGYNPDMHFQSDFLSYDGSNTDFLGFDNGTRNIPTGARQSSYPTPNEGSGQEVFDFVNQYNPTLGPTEDENLANYSLSATLGNQYDVGGGNTLGYVFAATYRKNTNLYQNQQFGEFQNNQASSSYDLVFADLQSGTVAEENILLGGLAGLAFKTNHARYKLTGMHLQNGESQSTNLFRENSESAVGQSGFEAESFNLAYSERGVTNILLNGTHYFDDARWEIDWRVSPTFSTINDPDIRTTSYTLPRVEGNPATFNSGAGGFPSRLWRFMDEVNWTGKIDITREYELMGETAKVQAGGSYVYKQRDYSIFSSSLAFTGTPPQFPNNNYNPNMLLDDDNLFGNGGDIFYQSGNPDPNSNAYNANVNNIAGYISNEFNPLTDLKMVIGLRAENYVLRHTGRDIRFAQGAASGNNLDNAKVLDNFNLFPSANLTYAISESINARFSYSRTVARPTFKELSFAQILDPISGRTYNGGLFPIDNWDGNLGQTDINNFDVRLEKFFNGGELISISGFYKTFKDPIELVRIQLDQTTPSFQPRNVGDGELFGAEFEVRKALGFVSSGLQNFSVSGNLTLVQSSIEMTQQEFQARQRFEKDGQDVDDMRQMAGQAPYIINAGVLYDNAAIGLDGGLFYNVKGETLTIVGNGLNPDVYTEPFHSLRFNLNKSLGAASLSLSVSNILNDDRAEYFENFRSDEQVYNLFSPGTEISLGFDYAF